MKFNGNPSEVLGIDYHAFSDGEKNGKKAIRYVLSNKITPEQEQSLSQYDNVEVVKNGCSYRYAPEIKYDVLYVYEEPESEAEESSFESFEDEHLGIIEDDSDEILNKLNEEVNQNMVKQDEINRFGQISSAINMANNLALIYKELSVNEKESQALFETFANQVTDQASQLQSLLQIPSVTESSIATEEVEDEGSDAGEVEGDFYEKLTNSPQWNSLIQECVDYVISKIGGDAGELKIEFGIAEDGIWNLLEGYEDGVTEDIYNKWLQLLDNQEKRAELARIFSDSYIQSNEDEDYDFEDYYSKINIFFKDNGLDEEFDD